MERTDYRSDRSPIIFIKRPHSWKDSSFDLVSASSTSFISRVWACSNPMRFMPLALRKFQVSLKKRSAQSLLGHCLFGTKDRYKWIACSLNDDEMEPTRSNLYPRVRKVSLLSSTGSNSFIKYLFSSILIVRAEKYLLFSRSLESELRTWGRSSKLNSWIKYGRKLRVVWSSAGESIRLNDSFVDIRGIDFEARTRYIKSFEWSTSKYPWILFKPIPVELQGSSSPEESGSRREMDFLLSNSILSRAVFEKGEAGIVALFDSLDSY